MSCNNQQLLLLFRAKVLMCLFFTNFGGYYIDGLEKRSDDVSPLEQVVQQQAAVIQQQAAELAALRNDFNALTSRHNKVDHLNTVDHGVFVFDRAISNTGNGYDTHTGFFTAPYSGTYFFLVSVLITNGNYFVQLAIDKSGIVLGLANAESRNGYWDKAVCHVTVHLQTGEKVWMRHNLGHPELSGGMLTTFSGILIHAD